MWEDPIVAEVHRAREKLAAENNFSVTAFFANLRRRQVALGERLIRKAGSLNQALKLNEPEPANVESVRQSSDRK